MNKRYVAWALGLLAIASLLTPVTAEARRYRGGRGYRRGYSGYRYRPYRSYRYSSPYYGGYYGYSYPYYRSSYRSWPGFGISFGF